MQFVRCRSKRLGHPRFFPKGMYFGGFALRFTLEDLLLANSNQFKDIGGLERKGISRRSGCAWISQHKLHHTHVSLFLHRTESVSCSKNTVDGTNRATVRVLFSDSAHTVKVKNARSSGWSLVHERINAVPVCFACFSENRNLERGRDNERVAAPMTCHCVSI